MSSQVQLSVLADLVCWSMIPGTTGLVLTKISPVTEPMSPVYVGTFIANLGDSVGPIERADRMPTLNLII